MMRRLTAFGAGLGILVASSTVHAQPATAGGFGSQGEFIFGADRLVPLFTYSSVKTSVTDTDPNVTNHTVTTNQTSFSFFWGSNQPNETFFDVPRLGFDYTIIPNVTLGGDLVLFFTAGGSTSDHREFKDGHTTDVSSGAPSTTIFGIAPRAGYVLGLSDVFSLWLRGGVSFYTASTKNDLTDGNGNKLGTHTDSVNEFAIDLEPMVVISPINHFAFTVGPTVDIPLTGKHNVDDQANNGNDVSSSFSYSQFHFGISAGLIGWFGG